jgi:uncharacterized protein YndB with AHSA1/START domain
MTLGRLDTTGQQPQLIFTRRLTHAPEKVWRALTEAEHLKAWFPTTIEGERKAGAKLRFSFPGDKAPPFDGEMLAYDPPKVMELRWGGDTLRFHLQPDGDGTLLTLTDTIDEYGKAARDAAGWHEKLDYLEVELAGENAPWEEGEVWKRVHPEYVERFGREAATIGPPEGFEAED